MDAFASVSFSQPIRFSRSCEILQMFLDRSHVEEAIHSSSSSSFSVFFQPNARARTEKEKKKKKIYVKQIYNIDFSLNKQFNGK